MISIFAILASLLSPAINTVFETANTLKCTQNLSQLGAINHLYSSDFEDKVVIAMQDIKTSWDDSLSSYLGFDLTQKEIEMNKLHLADRPDYPEILHCPSDPKVEAKGGGIRRSYSLSMGKPKDYHIKRGMSGEGWSSFLSDATSPSKTLLMIEFPNSYNRVGMNMVSGLENVYRQIYSLGFNTSIEYYGIHTDGSFLFNYLFADS
ncbi:MAG: hypothetical protein HQL32_15175, partial [Planctomycetes bacterium]|nr:hypothetical protein [Planctomycetota bacterium]